MRTPFGEIPDRFLPDMSMPEAHEYLQQRRARRARLSRRQLLRGLAAGAATVAAGPILLKQPARAATPPQGARVLFGDDPTRSMAISWGTPGDVQAPAVEYWRQGRGGPSGFLRAERSGGVAGSPTVYHHVRIDGLDPDTAYGYRIVHNGSDGRAGTFRTAPDQLRPIRFTSFGDQGVYEDAAGNVARIAALDPDLHFHVGDLCYAYGTGIGEETGLPTMDETDQDVWDEWFRQNEPVSAHVPWMPLVGNHEMEYGYGEQGYDGLYTRYELPGSGVAGAPLTYAFTYGNVGFVALDGNDASYQLPANQGWLGESQDEWLRRTLSELRGDDTTDFIVAGYHNCSYCSNGMHGSDRGHRDRWNDLFDEFSVDLVINGHNHCYERTHALRRGEVAAEAPVGAELDPTEVGTIFITAGGGGADEYPAFTYPFAHVHPERSVIFIGPKEVEVATWSATRYLGPSVLVADVDPPDEEGVTRLRLRGMATSGDVFDEVVLRRSSKAADRPPGRRRGVGTPPWVGRP
jgi:hypothetical protein